jgi:hypothetical protein
MSEIITARPRYDAVALRFGLADGFLIAAVAGLWIGQWMFIAVAIAAMFMGGPVDEAVGDDRTAAEDFGRWFCVLGVYATAPLIALLFLVHLVAVRDALATVHGSLGWPWQLVGTTVCVGYFYAMIGATAAHELTHWSDDRIAQSCARVLLSFTFNATFPIYHVHGHHRNVALFRDSATARRGEYALVFVVRTIIGQSIEAFEFEANRLRRMNRSAFSWRNRALNGQIYSVLLCAAFAAFLGAALVGRVIHELVNFVQHYGLVRIEGAPVEPRHSWDCHRRLSSALTFNLPRHAEHHRFAARQFWRLQPSDRSPLLPCGYHTMAVVALLPPLWRRVMGPALADWDKRLASDAELQTLNQRGWADLI